MGDRVTGGDNDVLGSDVSTARLFRRYAEYLSDVSDVDYTSNGEAKNGFGDRTAMFCDNVTFKLVEGMDVKEGFQVLRRVLGEQIVLHKSSNGYGAIRIICTPSSSDGITAGDFSTLNRRGITMLDVDYAVDACNIVIRNSLLEFLSQNWKGGVHVADRGSSVVGDNCLSWWGTDADGGRIRIKVYNAFAQVLESGGVRVLLGSSLCDLLKGTGKANTLLEYKDYGVSRIEITFYGESLKNAEFYRHELDVVLQGLATCPTFRNNLSSQWRAFAAKIIQTAALYDVQTSTFAYAHWWNSKTKMVQGATRTISRAEEVSKLLGNYSFYERPIHLITIDNTGESVASYIRVHGGSSITMCCGAKRGLYPSNPRHQLYEYGDGVGRVTLGILGWPQTYSFRSRALAHVEKITEAAVSDSMETLVNTLEALTITNRDYQPAYKALEVGKQYTVIGVGTGDFRGKTYRYAKFRSGERVRCGASLQGLIDANPGRMFTFTVDRIPKWKGHEDAICFISTDMI